MRPCGPSGLLANGGRQDMGDIQLFRLEGDKAVELSATSATLERKLQRLRIL